MSKRTYLSGSEKRKKLAAQKENINKLPKLTSFFTVEETNRQTDSSNSSSQDASKFQSSETGPTFDIEDNISVLSSSVPDIKTVTHTSQPGSSSSSYCDLPTTSILENISHDPGTYCDEILTEEVRDIWIRKGPEFFQNKNCDFSETSTSFPDLSGKTKTRNLTRNVFTRKLTNGECVERKWLLYSPSKKSVYCYCCRLFNNTTGNNLSSSNGYKDWKHISNLLMEHENSLQHRQSMMNYVARSKTTGRVDSGLLSQYNAQVNYWKNVLKRIVAVVKFLASRGLGFRGDNEILRSQNNGNYLGCLELISEFDPFLADHMQNCGNRGKGSTSYLSANICNEFINIMGQQVLTTIVNELKAAKYYSISVDSTPDLSHVDQLTFIARYVKDGEPIERFLQFLPMEEHKAQYIAATVLNFLESLDIPIKDCRGQSYDNAPNMAGKYSGLQTRIKEKCEFAIFVPCATHSLNLVGVQAVGCVLEAVAYFQFIQNLFNFFSGSTNRWKIMTECLGANKVLKSLSETRWSARADALNALQNGYNHISEALTSIARNTDQPGETRNEAQSLAKKMEKLETILLTEIWNDLLGIINKTSISLQNYTMTMDVATKLFASLADYISSARSNFDQYESAAKEKNPNADYKDNSQRKGIRSTRITFLEGPSETVQLNGKEKFRIETFLPIIDTLDAHLKQRSESYKEVNKRFSFLSQLKTIDSDQLTNKCKEFAEFYHEDINANELKSECFHLRQYLKNLANESADLSISALHTLIKADKLEEIFPNVEVATRIFLCLMVTNCSGERSFSQLKRIKNELRTTMLQERLTNLSIMCIESDILQKLDFEDIIEDFAQQKSRKKPLSLT